MTTKLKTSDFWPLVGQFVENLSGESGRKWYEAGKLFLRRENPWPMTATTPGIIDLDAAPFVPNGLRVEEHKKGGQFVVDPAKIFLHLSKKQADSKVIEGNKLRKELADQPVLNANALDFFLANPHLIPEECKGKAVFFWGTIYRNSDGYLCVRCLCWSGVRWDWSCHWLDRGWTADSPAACAQASA